MSKFTTTQRKLRKLWEQIHKNEGDLSDLDNKEELKFFTNLSKQQTIKNIVEIDNSDFFTIGNAFISQDNSPSFGVTDENGNPLPSSTEKDTLLPIVYSYDYSTNLDIPKSFLPFIKTVPQVKAVPEYTFALTGKFTSSIFDINNDTIQIKAGVGGNIFTTLYEGNPATIESQGNPANIVISVFSGQELIDFKIPIANTKKVFDATIFYTRSGENFKVEGIVTRLVAVFDNGTTGCDSQDEFNTFDAVVFREGTAEIERGNNVFLGLSPTGFSMVCRKTETRFVDVPPCTQQDTVTEGVSLASSFASTDSFDMTIVGKITNLTTTEVFANSSVILDETDIITSQSFLQNRHRAYYSDATEGILSVEETGLDPEFLERIYELDSFNLPDTDKGHTLPYPSIQFLRNLEGFGNENPETNTYIQHTKNPIKAFMEKSDGTFFMTSSGTFLLTSKVQKEDTTSSDAFPRYSDTYTISGTTYILSSENHSFIIPTLFIPEVIDVEVRVRTYLQNPLYWREDREYVV